jgi:hypothetical protein
MGRPTFNMNNPTDEGKDYDKGTVWPADLIADSLVHK